MPQYKIELQFNQNPLPSNELSITTDFETLFFTFETGGADPGSILIGLDLYDTVTNTINMFNLYYNKLGRYTVTRPLWSKIQILVDSATIPVLDYNTSSGVVASISASTPAVSILSLSNVANVSNACGLIDVDVVTSSNVKALTSPYVDNTFSGTTNRVVNIVRGSIVNITVVGLDDQVSSSQYRAPSLLSSGSFSFDISYGTVLVLGSPDRLDLEYSLDGINWTVNNSFNNLNNGTYDMHIKDQYGCQIQIPFTITQAGDGTTPGTGVEVQPYFFYSKANSIRMAKVEQIDNIEINKNPFNTLSCEEEFDYLIWKQKHIFRSSDVPVIQFKSNISGVEVRTSDDNTLLPIAQKSINMNIKEAIGGIAMQFGPNQLGIYFISGNTYNYDNTSIVEGAYELGGILPSWAKADQIITIGSINYPILATVYDEVLRVNMLIINSFVTPGNVIVKTIYNKVDYEVFEVTVPLLGRKRFSLTISYEGKDQYKSELIEIDNNTNRLLLVKSTMSYNTDMVYSTGIEPFFRLQYDNVKLGTNRENDKYNTDDKYIQIDARRFDVEVFKLLPVTRSMARVLDVIFSNDTININGISYVTESFTYEALSESNLYTCEATMIVAESGLYKDSISTETGSVVELIKTEADEYVKLK